jgi:O-antigen ligase
VALANQMTFVLLPVLGVLLCGPWRFDKTRLKLFLALLIIAAGLNFTYTRSGVFALAPGIMAMSLLMRGGRRLLIISLVLMAAIIFPMLENTGLVGHRYFRDASDDQSAQSHDALYDVGLAIALDNWIVGIGHEHFEETVWDYIDTVDTGSETVTTDDALNQRPHNDWLSVWLSWGILALIAYILIFAGTLWNLAVASRHEDPFIHGLAVGCFGGVIVYGVSSAYHNYMDSSVFLWLFAGISVALVRLPSNRHRKRREPARRAHQLEPSGAD